MKPDGSSPRTCHATLTHREDDSQKSQMVSYSYWLIKNFRMSSSSTATTSGQQRPLCDVRSTRELALSRSRPDVFSDQATSADAVSYTHLTLPTKTTSSGASSPVMLWRATTSGAALTPATPWAVAAGMVASDVNAPQPTIAVDLARCRVRAISLDAERLEVFDARIGSFLGKPACHDPRGRHAMARRGRARCRRHRRARSRRGRRGRCRGASLRARGGDRAKPGCWILASGRCGRGTAPHRTSA